MTLLQVLLTVLAVHRITVLITTDKITKPARDWLDHRFTGTLIDLVYCTWCVSVWVAAGAVALTRYQWGWWQWVCLGLAASGVTGFITEKT